MKPILFRILACLMAVALLLQPFQLASGTTPEPAMAVSAAPALISPQSPSAIFNTNLVPDGDAENSSYSNYWTDNGPWMQTVAYGASCGATCNYPTPYDPGPVLRYKNFFYAGTVTSDHSNGTNMWIKDKIDISSRPAAIDAGRLRYDLSGYFGGDGSSTVTLQIHMWFDTCPNNPPPNSNCYNLGEVIVGNVTASDRQNKTALLYREKTGFVPAGTRYINLLLQTGNSYGYTYPDHRTGYADDLSLILNPVNEFLPLASKPQTQAPPSSGYPAPSGIYVAADGLTRMDIYWTNNTRDELGFEVQRINPDASVDTICNTGPNITECFDIGHPASGHNYLGNHVQYTYQVKAIGPDLDSAWASGNGYTNTMPVAAPSPTQGSFTCQAIDTSATSTTFVWNDPFNYEAGFNVYIVGNSTPSWSLIEGDTKISLTNLTPGSSISLRFVPFIWQADGTHYTESSTSCTATANLLQSQYASAGVTRFNNKTTYPIISLIVDGWEQLPVSPLDISPTYYYEMTGVTPEMHHWTATTGVWDEYGERFEMHNYSGNFNQDATDLMSIDINDLTINDLLTVPPKNIGYWEGYYFSGSNCHTAAFKFYANGTYDFYKQNIYQNSGTYSIVEREPAIFSDEFNISGVASPGLLIETMGEFHLSNGQPSWPQITYVFKPQGYVYNAFCP